MVRGLFYSCLIDLIHEGMIRIKWKKSKYYKLYNYVLKM